MNPRTALLYDTVSRCTSGVLSRIRRSGIRAHDDEQTRQAKAILVLATGLASFATTSWLLLYWTLDPRFSSILPMTFQLLLGTNLLLYIYSGNFTYFRLSQLALLLFFPFAAEWGIGNTINASGILLWGLLAPIGALLSVGIRQSLPWFIAYIVLLLTTGLLDYYLADLEIINTNTDSMRNSIIFFTLNFMAISTIVFLLLRFAINQRLSALSGLEEANRLLLIEKGRSEQLLLNILPPGIADRLKDQNSVVADNYPEASIMFADIVHFTQIAAGMDAQQVFAMLNEIFSKFDEQAELLGLEKIKTIGDAYMVAGGLNTYSPDSCLAIARLALNFQDLITQTALQNNLRLRLRIGIATGPVAAGVVGKRKFHYDVWGDTVNIASRLCGEAEPGEIYCNYTSYKRLEHLFSFAPVIEREVKGKGAVQIYPLRIPQSLDDTSSLTNSLTHKKFS